MSFHQDSFHQKVKTYKIDILTPNEKFVMDSDEMDQLAEALAHGFNSGNISTLDFGEFENMIEKFIRWYDLPIDVSPTYYNDDGTINESYGADTN